METPYDFGPFLERLRENPYRADPLLRAILRGHGIAEADLRALEDFGSEVTGPLWDLADGVDRPDNLPVLTPYDPYHGRVDDIRLPARTSGLWAATFGRGLAAPEADLRRELSRFAHLFLFEQLGEVGTACPIVCTDGLVRVVERHGAGDMGARAVAAIRANSPGRIVSGAQFVTEIHAGSDAAQVAIEARPSSDGVTLDGAKWFCSNVSADYWLVLAQHANLSGETVLVLVDRAAARRSARVDRLKDKLGTRALATAEVTFTGAPGWVVGEPGRGLSIVVGLVLATSRVHIAVASAAFSVLAARAARAYAEFRSAFGRRLAELPLVKAEVDGVSRDAAELEAGAWAALSRWLRVERTTRPEEPDARASRLLVGLAKRRVTFRATRAVHRAMMVLGGNGIEERFSPLPRLLRDAVINETWEGPHNLLVAQAHKDLSTWHRDGQAGEALDALLDGVPGAAALRDGCLGDLAGEAGPAFAARCDGLFDALAAAALDQASG